MKRMKSVFCLAEDEITDTKEEGLTHHILESCLHRPSNLCRVEVHQTGQNGYSRTIDTGDHHGDPGAHEQDAAKHEWVLRVSGDKN